jgi:integrase
LKSSFSNSNLAAQVRVIVDDVGRGKNRRALRRPLLVDRNTGLLYELPTTYVFRTLGQKSLNTQLSTLYDLAFYLEWVRLKQGRSLKWSAPEARVRLGQPPITEREINDLANWCQSSAQALSQATGRESAKLRVIPKFDGVDSATSNKRLQSVLGYLIWLTRDQVAGSFQLDDRQIAKAVRFEELLRDGIKSSSSASKKARPFASLDEASSAAVRAALFTFEVFSDTKHGRRDRLIARVLYESGLRAGELLKLRCEDLLDNYEISPNRFVGILKVLRRPNDAQDVRRSEPAVKTLPGPVTISKALAAALLQYVIGDRRHALDSHPRPQETPYLFVCHSGSRSGLPISQRNLNRIIAKLKLVTVGDTRVSPHTLRHTHFTELMDKMLVNKVGSQDAERILQQRGHWSPGSQMPGHYTQRHTARRQAFFTDQREQILEAD